jgi:hypothetical protein
MKLEWILDSARRQFRNQLSAKFSQVRIHSRRVAWGQLFLCIRSDLLAQLDVFLRRIKIQGRLELRPLRS